MTERIMIYVQHLLGTGHLKRMALLADALAGKGAAVTLVSGGLPAVHIAVSPAVRMVQLPPIRSIDQNFSGLADETGEPVTDAFKLARTQKLLEILHDSNPDQLIVELFPLGRRQMRFELLPLLDAARVRCGIITCSVRDIVNRRPHREAESLDWLNRFFDRLMVHGDERLTPISDSVPGIAAFKGDIIHTGYLAEPAEPPQARGEEVLVTAGGGAAGATLFRAAAAASRQLGPSIPWRIRHGASAPPDLIGELKAVASADVIIEPVADDFRQRLGRAGLSISQFGYNTAMDILQSGTPAIIVPFEHGGETEQLHRAEALAGPGLTVLREAALKPETLAQAVGSVIADRQPPRCDAALDGLAVATQHLLAR